MLRPVIISWIRQRGYHIEPRICVRDVRQGNQIVATAVVEFTHIFQIR